MSWLLPSSSCEFLLPPLLCSHPHNPVWLRFWFIHTSHISVHHYGPLTFTGDYSGGMGRVRGQKGQGSCGQCSAVFVGCILYDLLLTTLIARFMRPTWGPSGADRTQLGPMLAPCTLLSGKFYPLTWKWLAEEIPWNHCLRYISVQEPTSQRVYELIIIICWKFSQIIILIYSGHEFAVVAYAKLWSGPWINTKMLCYQYRKSHCGDKTVVGSSYLHNGISYTGKMSSLYIKSDSLNNWLVNGVRCISTETIHL